MGRPAPSEKSMSSSTLRRVPGSGGNLAIDLAHELVQPLSSISNLVEVCCRQLRAGNADSERLLALLSEVASQSMRAADLVSHLRRFLRQSDKGRELVEATGLAENLPLLFRQELEREAIGLELFLATEPLAVFADPVQLEQALVNLVRNAIDSIVASGARERRVEVRVELAAEHAAFTVRDTGGGIAEADADRLFEAFYSTKPDGLGLGLSLCRSIVESHGGGIRIAPAEPGPGAVVRFEIPLAAPVHQKGGPQ